MNSLAKSRRYRVGGLALTQLLMRYIHTYIIYLDIIHIHMAYVDFHILHILCTYINTYEC